MRPRKQKAEPGAALMRPQLPVVARLAEKRRDTPRMATLLFPHPKDAAQRAGFDARTLQPGQFVMVWLPGVDEKPYAVSCCDDSQFGITVHKRGRFSTALHELPPNAPVGFRGPYGRGFWDWEEHASDSRAVIIGGGCGMAPLALLAERMPGATVVQGAPNGAELLYRDRFPRQVVYTEDGSAGQKGLPTEWLRHAIERGEARSVYACGPEPMLSAVVAMCLQRKAPCQVSLERYMKCGFGVCGQCECDGRLVCQDGPVFSADELRQMPSFGEKTRLASGQKVTLAQASECAKPPAADGRPST